MNIKKYLVVLPFLASCNGFRDYNMWNGQGSSKQWEGIDSDACSSTTSALAASLLNVSSVNDIVNRVEQLFNKAIDMRNKIGKVSNTLHSSEFKKMLDESIDLISLSLLNHTVSSLKNISDKKIKEIKDILEQTKSLNCKSNDLDLALLIISNVENVKQSNEVISEDINLIMNAAATVLVQRISAIKKTSELLKTLKDMRYSDEYNESAIEAAGSELKLIKDSIEYEIDGMRCAMNIYLDKISYDSTGLESHKTKGMKFIESSSGLSQSSRMMDDQGSSKQAPVVDDIAQIGCLDEAYVKKLCCEMSIYLSKEDRVFDGNILKMFEILKTYLPSKGDLIENRFLRIFVDSNKENITTEHLFSAVANGYLKLVKELSGVPSGNGK